MKTRNNCIEDAQARLFKLLNELTQTGTLDRDVRHLITLELDLSETMSDEWYELAETEKNKKRAALYFKIAQAVLVRNGYRDGLPFCPLCGKLGHPEHNGAPLIEGNVCEACNQRKVIPARIRAAQKEETC
ncbi:MAG: hypothetical protein IIY54_10585 [Ruminococcus sp.]|nr:hypothetical protein [Ruminococcus sp.]MBQ1310144.1 hypothetical protein [Ruminococcus sp.]